MLLIVFLCFGLEIHAIINPHGPTVINDFVRCIQNIMTDNFIKPGLIIFANYDNMNNMVKDINDKLLQAVHKNHKYLIHVINPDTEAICEENKSFDITVLQDQYEAIPLAEYYVIIEDNYNILYKLLCKMVKSRHWNPYAKFVILSIHFKSILENKNHAENVLTCLFKYNAIDIIVVVPEFGKMRNSIIYSWRPYAPPKYCGYFNETAKDRLFVENMCERGVIKYKRNIFNSKFPSNMLQCSISLIGIERNPFVSRDSSDPNIEKQLVKSIFNKFNISLKYNYTNSFRGERNVYGNWNGALKKVVSKQGQILLGGIFPDFDVHEDFECSLSYLGDSYTWVVPIAKASPPWLALTVIFTSVVWYSVISGFFVCVFTWQILGYLSCDSLYNKILAHCFMNTWISVFGFCSYTRPIKNSVRIFFVFFNLYCILFLTAYQTKLINVLQTRHFDEQIDTIEELVSSGIKFGGFEPLHDLFLDSSDPFDRLIGEQWVDIDNMTKAMIDVVVHRNFSVLCSRLELAHISAIMPELHDAYGKHNYFAFKNDMFSVPLEMIALRGFPFMKKISHTLSLHKQLGINDGVRKQFATYNIRKRAKLLQSLNKTQSKLNPLSVQHLQGGFLALLLGGISGSFVLLLEILINKWNKCNVSWYPY